MEQTQEKIEQTIKSNKMIAEFMGWKDSKTHKGFLEPPSEINYYTPMHVEDFEYHKKWNLLMPVVEKIGRHLPKQEKENNYIQSSIKIEAWINSGYPYNFMTNCKIGDLSDRRGAFYISKGNGSDGKDGSLINSVWSAVLEFIQWHNKTVVRAVTPNELQK